MWHSTLFDHWPDYFKWAEERDALMRALEKGSPLARMGTSAVAISAFGWSKAPAVRGIKRATPIHPSLKEQS